MTDKEILMANAESHLGQSMADVAQRIVAAHVPPWQCARPPSAVDARAVDIDAAAVARLDATGASEAVCVALLAYVKDHRRPGDFLRALLSNDLCETLGRADETNSPAIGALVRWLYNEAPSQCWGSPARVKAWLAGAP